MRSCGGCRTYRFPRTSSTWPVRFALHLGRYLPLALSLFPAAAFAADATKSQRPKRCRSTSASAVPSLSCGGRVEGLLFRRCYERVCWEGVPQLEAQSPINCITVRRARCLYQSAFAAFKLWSTSSGMATMAHTGFHVCFLTYGAVSVPCNIRLQNHTVTTCAADYTRSSMGSHTQGQHTLLKWHRPLLCTE
jgi:hypothetical protein